MELLLNMLRSLCKYWHTVCWVLSIQLPISRDEFSVLFLELALLLSSSFWTGYTELQLWTGSDKEKYTNINTNISNNKWLSFIHTNPFHSNIFFFPSKQTILRTVFQTSRKKNIICNLLVNNQMQIELTNQARTGDRRGWKWQLISLFEYLALEGTTSSKNI